MVSIHCIGVGERPSEDSFVSFGAKTTQRACTRDFLRDRENTKKRQGPRAEQKGVIDNQQKATVSERRLLKEELWPVATEAMSANARGWVSVPGSSVGIFFLVHARDSTEAQNARKVPKLLPSYA